MSAVDNAYKILKNPSDKTKAIYKAYTELNAWDRGMIDKTIARLMLKLRNVSEISVLELMGQAEAYRSDPVAYKRVMAKYVNNANV